MRSPKPLTFKYSTMVTTVTQNAEDYEAIKIEQTQGAGRWQAVELMPEEIEEIMASINAGRKEGVVTHVGDIINKTKFKVTERGIRLIGWATDAKGANPIGDNMAVMLKLSDFKQIEGWMVSYKEEVSDPIEEAFEADILSFLGYNK